MENTNICAGIVLFNPDIERLSENINAIIYQVEKIIIIDNASENIVSIEKLITKYSNVTLIKNDINYGIAKALNQIVFWAEKNSFSWVLTLDQDSVCSKHIIENYTPYLSLDNIGMVICDIVDRNYQLKRKQSSQMRNFDFVTKCITSGCLTNVKACIESGMFDERLFIDSVDYDMCYSMQEHGYKILNIHFIGLLHEVGKSEKHSIFGFEFAVNNHSALRKYYISRNSTFLIYKHHLNKIVEYFYIYRRLFTVIVFEKDKYNKCKSIVLGIHDGKKMGKDIKKKVYYKTEE